MKKQIRKLSLNKKTISNLSASEINRQTLAILMKRLSVIAAIVLSTASCDKQHVEQHCGVISDKGILENSSYKYIFYINGYAVPVDSLIYEETPIGTIYCSEWLANYSRT